MNLIKEKKNYVALEQRREEAGVAHFVFTSEIIMQWNERSCRVKPYLVGDLAAGRPRLAGPRRARPRSTGPRWAGPRWAGPRWAGPRWAGTWRAGPRRADFGGTFLGIQLIKKEAVRKDNLTKYCGSEIQYQMYFISLYNS